MRKRGGGVLVSVRPRPGRSRDTARATGVTPVDRPISGLALVSTGFQGVAGPAFELVERSVLAFGRFLLPRGLAHR